MLCSVEDRVSVSWGDLAWMVVLGWFRCFFLCFSCGGMLLNERDRLRFIYLMHYNGLKH